MENIFVQIASYRDRDLPNTIDSALKNAQEPQRLTFGICWQYDEKTWTDLDHVLSDPRFRIAQFYYEDSLGCCWARHQTNRLYDGEAYTLQIDAHTRFAPQWDVRFIDMLDSLDSEKPVLTTYPSPFIDSPDGDELTTDRGVQRLELRKLHKDLTTTLRGERVEDVEQCPRTRFIAAGQIFTHGRFCHEVEYDPELYYAGEELNLTVRAFSHGYDFFAPNQDLLWHRYRHSMPTHWTDHSETRHQGAIERLHTLLLGDHTSLGQYGLGPVKTLSEFEQFIDVDFKARAARVATPMRFTRTIKLDVSGIEDRQDYQFWIFTLRSIDDVELYRHDIFDSEILSKQVTEISVDEQLDDAPCEYMLWPFIRGKGYQNQHLFNL